MTDNVNHPKHYTNSKTGIEVIEVTSLLNFDLGNAFKYLARYKTKKDPAEDVNKAVWYLNHYASHLNSIDRITVVDDTLNLRELLRKMEKFVGVEDVPCIKRALLTITQTAQAEDELCNPEEDLPLLRAEEWKITIQELKDYAERIKGMKPEDFNG